MSSMGSSNRSSPQTTFCCPLTLIALFEAQISDMKLLRLCVGQMKHVTCLIASSICLNAPAQAPSIQTAVTISAPSSLICCTTRSAMYRMSLESPLVSSAQRNFVPVSVENRTLMIGRCWVESQPSDMMSPPQLSPVFVVLWRHLRSTLSPAVVMGPSTKAVLWGSFDSLPSDLRYFAPSFAVFVTAVRKCCSLTAWNEKAFAANAQAQSSLTLSTVMFSSSSAAHAAPPGSLMIASAA
mmetsp:Transcript_30070/g.40787  ORF Transcript_30070/g.40787 Transcript_30070/m.40787 type:complete len:239 (-) Transcript_30070:2254-2970(-)